MPGSVYLGEVQVCSVYMSGGFIRPLYWCLMTIVLDHMQRGFCTATVLNQSGPSFRSRFHNNRDIHCAAGFCISFASENQNLFSIYHTLRVLHQCELQNIDIVFDSSVSISLLGSI